MGNSIGVISLSLLALFAVVVWVLWATTVPVIGIVSGSVVAALGLGWVLIQIITAVSRSAAAHWDTSSSVVGMMFGFGLLGVGIGVMTASVMKSRNGDRPRPASKNSDDDAAELPTTVSADA